MARVTSIIITILILIDKAIVVVVNTVANVHDAPTILIDAANKC